MARRNRGRAFCREPVVGLRAGALAVVLALAAPFAAAEAPEAAAEPTLCEMAAAFDDALKARYYLANYAPDHIDCRFVGADGCRFALRRSIAIRVTHLGAASCSEAGLCAFDARQVCEDGGAACRELMFEDRADYRVEGRFVATEAGGWRLEAWRRTPAPGLVGAIETGADVAASEIACPPAG